MLRLQRGKQAGERQGCCRRASSETVGLDRRESPVAWILRGCSEDAEKETVTRAICKVNSSGLVINVEWGGEDFRIAAHLVGTHLQLTKVRCADLLQQGRMYTWEMVGDLRRKVAEGEYYRTWVSLG